MRIIPNHFLESCKDQLTRCLRRNSSSANVTSSIQLNSQYFGRPSDGGQDVWRYDQELFLQPDSCAVTQVGSAGGGSQVVLPGPPLTLQQVQQQIQQVQQVPANGHGHGPAMIIPQYIPFTQFPMPAGSHVQPNVLANVNVNVPLGQVRTHKQLMV